MKNIQELDSLIQVKPLEYDYFIYTKNSEKRSSNVLNIFKKSKIKIKNLIELQFEDTQTPKIRTIGSRYVITCPYRHVLMGIKSIFDLLHNLHFKINDKVCIDITGTDVPYFFHLLKTLKFKKMLSKIDLVYTEPETYKKTSNKFIFPRELEM